MPSPDVESRARATAGASNDAVYTAAVALLDELGVRHARLVDVGCGAAAFRSYLGDRCREYIGADAVAHPGQPHDLHFVRVDLDRSRVDLPDATADVVTSLETIEHVENPRALVRELHRLARPGGHILVTTPNQLSLQSKLGLVLKNEFVHFQERPGLYPAHITALLEIDLRRMLHEVGLAHIQVRYTGAGRIPLTARQWPRTLSRRYGRSLSDNVLIAARKPA